MSTDCPREVTQQSPHHSFGTVKDDEPLAYVLADPDHYRNGQLQKGAFSHRKLKTGSLSVCRIWHSTQNEVQSEVIDKLLQGVPPQGGQRHFVGLFRALCADVRKITVDYPKNNRAICVVDDGQPNYKAHAHLSYSVFAQEKDYWGKNNSQAVRANLVDAFGKGAILSLKDVFGAQVV